MFFYNRTSGDIHMLCGVSYMKREGKNVSEEDSNSNRAIEYAVPILNETI